MLSSGPFYLNAPREIRTPVLGLKGPRPGPLDDGGELDENSIIGLRTGQASDGQFNACPIVRSYIERSQFISLVGNLLLL